MSPVLNIGVLGCVINLVSRWLEFAFDRQASPGHVSPTWPIPAGASHFLSQYANRISIGERPETRPSHPFWGRLITDAHVWNGLTHFSTSFSGSQTAWSTNDFQVVRGFRGFKSSSMRLVYETLSLLFFYAASLSYKCWYPTKHGGHFLHNFEPIL